MYAIMEMRTGVHIDRLLPPNFEQDTLRVAGLLIDRGADVNSAMPTTASDSAGYTLLLYRTKMGLDDKLAYADALTLLERGADPNRAGADGMTFKKMLADHRAHFGGTPPAEFAALWDWAETHGVLADPK